MANLSNNILENVKNDAVKVDKVFESLIDDELEAIKGYEFKLDLLRYELDEEQLKLVGDKFLHIIHEEEEHIEELKQLAKDLNIELSDRDI